RITAAILLAPAGAPRDGKRVKTGFRMIDLARIRGVRDVTMRLTPRFIVRRALQQVYGDPTKLSDETVRRHHRMLLRAGNRQALVDAMSRRRGSAPAVSPSEVRQPTLLQWGELDTWIPVGDAARFAAVMPNAETILYSDLGHVPMEEAPERTARDARDFLRRHGLSDTTPTSP
ncbi:MAG: alpha/beta hydrolase, partial [Acidobacteriota bacterium]